MLIYFLVAVTLGAWGAVYFLYFRIPLQDWFGNRFGRESTPEIKELAPDEPRTSFAHMPSSDEDTP
ncbi:MULTISPECIES: hypothetical protein [Gluconobacter]|uniref:Uncharacterized protein n=1 Tax=Gluconobacter albidus TaxID=318683 RepID=A0A149SX13_9PROT|nr:MULTISPECIES: hypothetical protein [Gluconobacter]AQS90172.1 hypothetical protein A0U94_03430 [Gluconobacter albidus]KXV36548.1 hypothetical protein AD941_14430 [Gluconobacter albidus]KXV45820.1 hypothetical protein AD945_16735 [Gluconobacter albidus]MBS1027396.1 hypothetical protein [Gluconobacter albidus]MCP1272665.1 hypothetical protein [Gluconobacter albidus]